MAGCTESRKGGLPTSETECADGKDDDGDGAVDCNDGDCSRSEVCKVAHCRDVCVGISECEGIIEACTEKELAGVLTGCQSSCKDEDTRSQVLMADGVPCLVIGAAFIERVQGSGICLGEEAAADDT